VILSHIEYRSKGFHGGAVMDVRVGIKRVAGFVVAIAAVCVVLQCSEPHGGPGETLTALREMWQAGRYRDAGELMTADTQGLMAYIGRKRPNLAANHFGIDMLFAKKSEWTVIQKNIERDTAEIQVKYSVYPVENMKGFIAVFRFKKERGSWRWDLEKELSALKDGIEGQ
jgi:hypothetical protein